MKNTTKKKVLSVLSTSLKVVTVGAAGLALMGCPEQEEQKPEEKTEKSYLAPNTKVTIKYMGFASDAALPAEISKLAEIFTATPAGYSAIDRTIYVIDGSSAACTIKSDGTMEAERQWIINTAQDDVDDAIYALRTSWTSMSKNQNRIWYAGGMSSFELTKFQKYGNVHNS